MEEKLRQFIGKKVHITFESHRFKTPENPGGIYELNGIVLEVNPQWSYFDEVQTNYPPGFEYRVGFGFQPLNTTRIRSVEQA